MVASPRAPCRLGREGRARDRGRLPVVPLARGERLVDLRERVGVGEDALPRIAFARADQEVERARDDPRVVLDDADDLLRAPHEERGLELDLRAAADRADLEVRAAGAEHLEA